MWFDFSTDLEDEIVHDILRRLPVRSLARFKCVSKLWNYAISHPKFLQTQISVLFTTHHYVDQDNADDILIYEEDKHRLLHSVGTQSPIRSCSVPYLYGEPESYFITNSCHGLVVMVINAYLFLLNPSTNFIIKVLQLDRLDYLDEYDSVSCGFCYGDTTNDYKVVSILKFLNRYGDSDSDESFDDDSTSDDDDVSTLKHKSPLRKGEFVLVASLKSKSWSSIFRVGFHFSSVVMGSVVNGRPHCIARPRTLDPIDGARRVYHFDPRSDLFEELSMPKPRHNDEDAVFSLGVLDDRLVLCRKGEMGIKEYGSMEVMVMKEYGVSESWTTLFVISNVDLMQNLSYGTFTLFAKNGEVYIVKECQELVAYNPITETHPNVELIPDKPVYFKIDAAVCLDVSLVQPKCLKWDYMTHRKLASTPECHKKVR